MRVSHTRTGLSINIVNPLNKPTRKTGLVHMFAFVSEGGLQPLALTELDLTGYNSWQPDHTRFALYASQRSLRPIPTATTSLQNCSEVTCRESSMLLC